MAGRARCANSVQMGISPMTVTDGKKMAPEIRRADGRRQIVTGGKNGEIKRGDERNLRIIDASQVKETLECVPHLCPRVIGFFCEGVFMYFCQQD